MGILNIGRQNQWQQAYEARPDGTPHVWLNLHHHNIAPPQGGHLMLNLEAPLRIEIYS